jgi:hypothetical protein
MGGGGAPHYSKPLRSDAVLVVRQSPAAKDLNAEAEEATSLEVVIRQQMKSQQIEKN